MRRIVGGFCCAAAATLLLLHGACVDIVGVTNIPAAETGSDRTGDTTRPDGGMTCVGACTPGAQQCVPGNVVETCSSSCEWGDKWACQTGVCGDGGCSAVGPHTGVANPSCQVSGNTASCGPVHGCCETLDVIGGTYFRTYSSDEAGAPEGEGDPATVSGFGLDTFPVIVGRFRDFVTYLTGGGALPGNGDGKHVHLNSGRGLSVAGSPGAYEPGWDSSWNSMIVATAEEWDSRLIDCAPMTETWTPSPGARENFPINCVTWYEAFAFCIWDGGFLPSEAEEEYAAAGGASQLEYPWGATPPGTSNQYAIYHELYGDAQSDAVLWIAPVETPTKGAGTWGQFDLAGDVFEWTLDLFAPYADPCVDCANVTPTPSAMTRSVRGGDWGSPEERIVPPLRDDYSPASRTGYLGFRCARTP